MDPNRPGGTGQERPLNSAARRGRAPLVFLLLRAGADPAATDYDGETAAHAAARCGQVGAVEALAQAASVGPAAAAAAAAGEESREDECDHLLPWWFMVTDAGETATFVAAFEGHAGVLRALRAIGALEPSRPNAEGVTPMVAAALAGHSEVRAAYIDNLEVLYIVYKCSCPRNTGPVVLSEPVGIPRRRRLSSANTGLARRSASARARYGAGSTPLPAFARHPPPAFGFESWRNV